VTKPSTVMRPRAMLPAAEPDEASQPAQNRSRARRDEPQCETEAVRDQHIKAGSRKRSRTKRADWRTELDQSDSDLWCEYRRRTTPWPDGHRLRLTLNGHADIADEYGDENRPKTWRQVAAVASRITRRLRSA
jgi:hypothetical protein